MLSCRHFTNPMISITHQLLQRAARKVLAAAAAAVPITVRDFTRSRIPASSFPVELNLQCTATYSKYGLEKPENDYLMYVFFFADESNRKKSPAHFANSAVLQHAQSFILSDHHHLPWLQQPKIITIYCFAFRSAFSTPRLFLQTRSLLMPAFQAA